MIRTAHLLASLAFLAACSDYNLQGSQDKGGDGLPPDTGEPATDTGIADPGPTCPDEDWPAEEVGVGDSCPSEPEGGFTPVVEWTYGAGSGCLSLPTVADINFDGMPEIIVNLTDLFNSPGTLAVVEGDGSGLLWEDTAAGLAYGAATAVADLDGDGSPEIVGVRENSSGLLGDGDYQVVAWSADGEQLWESDHYTKLDFDWATAPVISDMDHDGSPEIVAGRVVLNADGTTRGVGEHGHGSYGVTSALGMTISEASVPAVTDLDLDGTEEIIVGDAAYDADGNTLRMDLSQEDAMIGVANLDDDPEGEVVAISYDTIRAQDTDGTVLWGPVEIPSANILATPAIADLDGDGYPEIVTAGGNQLVVFNHDGTELWTAAVHDMSGATGASIFDFEGDGVPEVVYIDEQEMVAYDGPTGSVKFYSTDHTSNTMFDYPVIADVDADDHAEIVVCNNGWTAALAVYGDADESWAPARSVWNQHAYNIANIQDDLQVPATATPSFADTNTWHSAIATDGESLVADLQAEILDICLDDCDRGTVPLTFRIDNLATEDQDPPVNVAIYAVYDGYERLLDTVEWTDALASGWGGEGVTVDLPAEYLTAAQAIRVAVDDDGTGTGAISECSETNNSVQVDGPFCE